MVTPIQAQETTLYLPLILKTGSVQIENMGYWSVISPQETTNFVLNPSAETTGNFSAVSSTVSRVTTVQKYGLYSYRILTNGDNQGISITLSTLTNAIHYVTVHVRGTLPASWDWSLDGTNFATPVLIEAIDEYWNLYGLQFSTTQSNGSTALRIYQNGAGSGDFYLDGIQVETENYWTTYVDGSQTGCYWNGTPNASTSTRSAKSRAGGRVINFDDAGFYISEVIDAGDVKQSIMIDKYASLPGGELNNITVEPRVFTLSGILIGDSESDLNDKRKDLIDFFSVTSYPKDNFGYQPARLRYNDGVSAQKEIAVFLESGLEGKLEAGYNRELLALRFVAPDPYFYGIGETAALLDTSDSATFRLIAARLKETGQWSNLGPPAGVAAGSPRILAFAENETYVYIGGVFENFDNNANCDNICRYNKDTGAYSALGTGLNGQVNDIIIAPNGDLYIGGEFTNAGGVAAADYITRWDGSNFNAVGTPVSGAASIVSVEALALDSNGNLYIGGVFTSWANVTGADSIVKWNGSNYSALLAGTNDNVYAIAIGLDDTVYIAGGFGDVGDGIASWNGTSFTDLRYNLSGQVPAYALAIGEDGTLYAGGSFNVSSSPSVAYLRGTTWLPMGSGLGEAGTLINSIRIAPDGYIYVGGDFDLSGDITIFDRVAQWNGSTWAALDINLPGSATVGDILPSEFTDPVTGEYDLYIGFDQIGTGTIAGITEITNNGSETYPKIVATRSGGTSLTLRTVRNEKTGKTLLLNYNLKDGETLTIDLNPLNKSIISNFYGSRLNAILANSDFGTWSLLGGPNDVSAFVSSSGSPTFSFYLLWKTTYRSFD
jgi:hypothetical protein